MSRIRNALHRPRFALVAALVTLSYFVSEWVVSATWRGQYGYRDDTVGPLGVPFCGPKGNWPCSALYPVMNIALIITGVAVLAVTLSWVVRRAITTPNAILLGGAGVGLAVAGAVTEQDSYPIHTTAMTVFLVLGAVGVFLVGSSGSTELSPSAKRFAVAAGVAAMVGYFGYTGGFTELLGSGGAQRLAVYSILVAIIVLGCSKQIGPVSDTHDADIVAEPETATF